jgi:hypothetical protein
MKDVQKIINKCTTTKPTTLYCTPRLRTHNVGKAKTMCLACNAGGSPYTSACYVGGSATNW